jgi:hypothetical protein
MARPNFVVAGSVIVMLLSLSCSFKQAQIALEAETDAPPQTHKVYI